MFHVLGRSGERPQALGSQAPRDVCLEGDRTILLLRMQENRSALDVVARRIVAGLGCFAIVISLGPAVHGQWVVSLFSLLALGGLTLALDRHGRRPPAEERLEVGDGRVRHRDSSGRLTDLSVYWLRLAAEGRSSADLRLVLRGRGRSLEIGRCLSLDERRDVAPVVIAALRQAGGL